MRYSKLFGKTSKSSKEYDSINATLLIKGGFINQTMAGVYTFLPLGLRVLSKIEAIIREEMNKIGSELLLPGLAPKELWETTGRFDTVDVLFKVEGANKASQEKNDATYVLNPTHEDVVTPLAKQFNFSYKDLPFGVYQIQTKYRNEARPKSGLLRGREFRMKDLYSFHKSAEELKEFYEIARVAYENVFNQLGLGADTFYTAASGGDFTEEFSHEFQTRCETGEDLVFHSKETGETFNREVAPSSAPSAAVTEEQKPMDEVFGENIVGVAELCEFLKTTPDHTTKTLIYETDKGVVVASVRGDYEVNELKLKKVGGFAWVKLAEAPVVKKVTGAEVGYAGLINLPKDVEVFIDDSVENLTNFETGGNKTNYHIVNVNWDRDIKSPEKFYDIKVAKEGDLYPKTQVPYEVFKACEVGNIFPLNTKFSKAFDYTYTDEKGEQKIVYMGSYGIGSSRTMGVVVEKFHNDKGIVWPENIAPFKVVLVGLNLEDENVNKVAQEVYERLLAAGVEVLFDDRLNVTAGEKFADADLIGIPYRAVVSKKTGVQVEMKKRSEAKGVLMDIDEFLNALSS